MANSPKSEVQYRIDDSDKVSLYAFAGFLDVLTAIPGVNILLAPITPLVMGTAYWSNGVSPFDKKIAFKLVQIGLLKFIPIVSMFPAHLRSTYVIVKLTRFEDRHEWLKDSLKLYTGTRAILKTKAGQAALKKLADTKTGQGITNLGKKFGGSRLGQAIGNDPRFIAALEKERAFGSDFTLKDVRPGAHSLLQPSGLTEKQKQERKEKEKNGLISASGEEPLKGDYAMLAGYATNAVKGIKDDIQNSRRGGQGARRDPSGNISDDERKLSLDEFRDAAQRARLDIQRQNDTPDSDDGNDSPKGSSPNVDGMRPNAHQRDEHDEGEYNEEEQRLREYSRNATSAAQAIRGEGQRADLKDGANNAHASPTIMNSLQVDGVRFGDSFTKDDIERLTEEERERKLRQANNEQLLRDNQQLPHDFRNILTERLHKDERDRSAQMLKNIEQGLMSRALQEAEAERIKTLSYIKFMRGVREKLQNRPVDELGFTNDAPTLPDGLLEAKRERKLRDDGTDSPINATD